MLICDTHADTLWALCAGKPAPLDIALPYLTAPGDTRVQALALFVHTGGMRERPTIVERELEAFQRLLSEGFRQIRTVEEARAGCANVLLTIEGGEAFGGSPEGVERFAALGVRAAALVWNNPNALAHPAVGGSAEGLTRFGREAVRRMQALRMAADVSHLNERGFWELMDMGVTPIASHSCARALCDHPRNLTDEQLRALFQAGGYVGVNFYPRFLTANGAATPDTVADHIAHMCELGGEACVGLGSDFDGIDEYPAGLRNAGDVPALLDAMRARGFGEALVRAIAGENFRRYMARLDAGELGQA